MGIHMNLTHLNNILDVSNFLLQVTGYIYMQRGRTEVRPTNGSTRRSQRLKESKGRCIFPREAADPQAWTRAWCWWMVQQVPVQYEPPLVNAQRGLSEGALTLEAHFFGSCLTASFHRVCNCNLTNLRRNCGDLLSISTAPMMKMIYLLTPAPKHLIWSIRQDNICPSPSTWTELTLLKRDKISVEWRGKGNEFYKKSCWNEILDRLPWNISPEDHYTEDWLIKACISFIF